jgi:hypothetical protein
MARRRERHTVVIALDTRMTLEALILNRLVALPVERRQTWLRELLVNGYRQHCAGLRAVEQGTARPTFGAVAASQRSPTLLPVQLPSAGEHKPFAALRQVMG